MIHSTEEFRKRFEEARLKAENYEDDYEDLIYDLESEIKDMLEVVESRIISQPNFGNVPITTMPDGKLLAELKKLCKDISTFKEEYGFYDEEAELDMMFPDRHDEDFDEDSISYDSIFGDD